jgi:hypothetical protein
MSDAQVLTELDVEKIRQLLDLKPGDAEPEQRSAERFDYPKTGQFAPWNGDGSPNGLPFFDVRFHDLSQTGVSFVVRRPPLSKYGVVRLGNPPGGTHMLVEVRHATARDGDVSDYLVGCAFIRRL